MSQEYCPYCMSPVEPDKPCSACGLTAGAYTPSAHHLPPGTVLRERYLVGRVLGEGGFGITYIGCDLRLELKVAIKEYFPTDRSNRVSSAGLDVSSYTGSAGAGYESGKKRFLTEARTMALLDKQPVIVTVRDFFEENNTAYIVMEYVEGTTLKDLTSQRGGRMAAGELLHMIEPLFAALSGMHQKGLIHRDISPENLMLENGNIRLLDFGCARESSGGESTLTIMLKHGFAPVEQYQSKGQGPWTDVYALSATIYYCLTGVKPPQAMDRLVEDELVPPRKLGAELTARQEQALLRGMGLRPRKRFQSIDELHTALYEGAPIPEVPVRLELEMTAEPSLARPGSEIVFLLKVRNTGVNTALGASVRPSLPKGLSLVEVRERDRALQTDSSSYPLRDIAPGGETSLRMTALLEDPPGDSLTFRVSLDCPGLEQHISAQAVVGVDDGRKREDVPSPKPAKPDWQSWVRLHRIQLMAGAGALLLVLALAVWRPWQTGSAPVNTLPESGPESSEAAPTASPEAEGSGPDESLAESSAAPAGVDFTGASNATNESQLRALLADGKVSAIVIDNPDMILTVSEPLEVQKPLLVKSHLFLLAPLTLDGAQLRIEGHVHGQVPVRTQNGGGITIAGEGNLDIGGLLWTAHGDDLRYEDGAQEYKGQHISVDETELFQDAVRVKTLKEFDTVCHSKKPIIIEDSFSINQGISLEPQGPVLIEEGVTVDLGWYDTLTNYGQVFINRGTLSGRLHIDDTSRPGILINYGTLDVASHFEGEGVAVNLGDWSLRSGEMFLGFRMINWTGSQLTLTQEPENSYFNVDGPFYNFGSMRLGGLQIRSQVSFTDDNVYNFGDISIDGNGVLANSSHLENHGTISAIKGSELMNFAFIENLGDRSLLQLGENSWQGEGIVTYGDHTHLEAFNREDLRHHAAFSWDTEYENMRWVSNEQELRAALADKACERVRTAGPITVEGDLGVNKILAMEHPLTVHGNLVVSGEQSLIWAFGGLESGSLLVEDGAIALTYGPLASGEATLKSGGVLYTYGYGESSCSLHAEDGGHVICGGYQVLQGSSLNLSNGGELRLNGRLHLQSCSVDIGENGVLRTDSGELQLDSASSLINRGELNLENSCWKKDNAWKNHLLAGETENLGTATLGNGVTLGSGSGSFVNQGDLILHCNPDAPVIIATSFQNAGQITSPGGGGFQVEPNGSVEGVPEELINK